MEVVAHAEKFVRTVEIAFGLEGKLRDAGADKNVSARPDKVSATSLDPEQPDAIFAPHSSPEETRRKAAENWRKNYYDKRAEGRSPEQESNKANSPDVDKSGSGLDGGTDFEPENRQYDRARTLGESSPAFNW